jgi:NAD(P)-dependent dehydrogenase (short-subunit alcohol dehydrogenase family)
MTSQTDFADRWVVVSGASSGIGRAAALALAAAGARVVLLGRRAAELEATATLCGSDRAQVRVIDLGDLDGIAGAIRDVVAATGPVYGLCHAAGVVQTLPLVGTTPPRLARQLDINLAAGLELARALTRREASLPDAGSFVFIASAYAHIGAPGQVAYAASKGAVVAAVRSLALELAPRRIRVNSVSPGLVRTPMTEPGVSTVSEDQWNRLAARHPLGTGEPDDVARAIMFLLDPRNRWVTGADLRVDGGFTLQ